MRDAILIQDLEFELHGNRAMYSNIWITELGEVYISLRIDEQSNWVNIPAKEIKRFIKK
jgi:hypothetical protein